MGAYPEYANGEVIANKYVVEGPLGESPVGRTYLANAGMGSQKLVVKILKADLSERLLSSPDFFLKANVASEIEHDNLAACIEVQEEMGLVYSARAHVEGHDFEEWLRRNRREGNYFTRGLELLWQACQGLSALHERTRHLNIHPGNVLISPLVAKLADWDPRSLGSMEMTPDPLPFRPQYAGYRAPEMAVRGSFLSYPSTDLYAVAGLLYRLIMGEHPENDLNKIQAGIRSLEKDLGGFLAKAMHPRAEERFQDASAFSDALWELQGAMQRLQERQPKSSGRESTSFRAPTPAVPPTPTRREEFSAPPVKEAVPPTLAMDAGSEGTLFGSTPAQAANPASAVKDDSFFNFFPTEQAQPSPAPARKQPPPPPAGNSTFFGSSLEAPAASGGTLFGDPPPAPATPSRPSSGGGASSFGGGLGSLETPGTLFGSDPEPPPSFLRQPAASPRSESRGGPGSNRDAIGKPAAVSLSSLEKDPLELEAERRAGGFTEFGFKGAGDNRTLYSEGGASGQRKLVIALGALGALILVLALGGLFIYLRGTAAPEIPPQAEAPLPVEVPAPDPAPEPASVQPPAASATSQAAPATDGPPYPVEESTPVPEPVAAKPPPPPPPRPAASAPTEASKGSPERLAQLMAMVQTRDWPGTAAQRLKAADELNDFGKVSEANLVYGRAMMAADITEKQKISALGGLAVTYYSMDMKPQALDAVNQILDINPKNAFASKFKEKLK